ncbi:integrin alpha FG-GAP repeat containing protein 1 [Nematocida sp. AWRm80]|nr:integrin alpha FG-GAP repeat containing protein 1 [Nematocida sp. AWRm80]
MWLFKRREESIQFEKRYLVKENFIPLAYSNESKNREVNIIGTDKNREAVIVIRKSRDQYDVIKRYSCSNRVDYIIPADINNDGITEYIVITNATTDNTPSSKVYSGESPSSIMRDSARSYNKHRTHNRTENKYEISVIGPTGTEMYLGESDTMPFVLCDQSLKPMLFTQKGSQTLFLSVERDNQHNQKINWHPRKERFGRLSQMHSSSFVDTNGNGIADIVLDTTETENNESIRRLQIWRTDLSKDMYHLVNELTIPKGCGPCVFGDFSGSGSTDILFFSNTPEPTAYIFLNNRPRYCTRTLKTNCLNWNRILENSLIGKEDHSSDNMKIIPLSSIPGLEEGEVLLYNRLGPIFPIVVDINNNTFPDVLVLFREKDSNAIKPLVLGNQEGTGFTRLECTFEDLQNGIESEIVSFSLINSERGLSDLLLCTNHNNHPILSVSKNVSDLSGYYLSLSTIITEYNKNSLSPAIGTTYACRITEIGRVLIGFYPPQSGFTPLQSPITIVGLGKTNVFVGSVHARTPSWSYTKLTTMDKVVPNSDLLMYVKNHQITNSLYLNNDTYWPITIPVVLTLLCVFGIASIYFTVKEKKRAIKAIVARRSRYNLNFDAL